MIKLIYTKRGSCLEKKERKKLRIHFIHSIEQNYHPLFDKQSGGFVEDKTNKKYLSFIEKYDRLEVKVLNLLKLKVFLGCQLQCFKTPAYIFYSAPLFNLVTPCHIILFIYFIFVMYFFFLLIY